MTPAGVTRPIEFGEAAAVYQRLPSGPAVIPNGCHRGSENSVMVAVGVILPIASAPPVFSVNQRFPSGPLAIPTGPAFELSPVLYSVTAGAASAAAGKAAVASETIRAAMDLRARNIHFVSAREIDDLRHARVETREVAGAQRRSAYVRGRRDRPQLVFPPGYEWQVADGLWGGEEGACNEISPNS